MNVPKYSEDEGEDDELLDDYMLGEDDDPEYSAPETILSGMEYTAALIWSGMLAQGFDRESIPPEMGNTLTSGAIAVAMQQQPQQQQPQSALSPDDFSLLVGLLE